MLKVAVEFALVDAAKIRLDGLLDICCASALAAFLEDSAGAGLDEGTVGAPSNSTRSRNLLWIDDMRASRTRC